MDADELTYQTHIWMRYELERRLLSGDLAVKDLRDAWNSLSSDRLGLVPATDLEGCLQDIHWAIGSFGHFPSYGVGAVIAGQLWETIREQLPGIEAEIATGQFGSLFAWLRERVHSTGASMGVPQLVQHATGRPLSATPFLRYLERKYVAGEPVPLECRHDSRAERNVRELPPARGADPGTGRQGDRRLPA